MAVSNNLGKISYPDAWARKAPGTSTVSGPPAAFTRGPDRVHNYARLSASELKEVAASIRNFVEGKNRRVEFVFNGHPAHAMPAFSGVEMDVSMNAHSGANRLFIHIGQGDDVSASPRLTQGQLTASLILARSAMMEKDQLRRS